MAPFIGFALVTHSQPEQIAFLCGRLAELFDDPPIAIHHDHSQAPLSRASLPSSARLVEDWNMTSWGEASVINAYLSALRLLHKEDSPEWTVSLSAADYPIKSAQRILDDLRHATVDGFLDFREVSRGCVQSRDAQSLASAFQTPEYMALAYERYLKFCVVPWPLLRRANPRIRAKLSNRARYLEGELLIRLVSPFSSKFRPYAGDWWHTLNRKAAAVLLQDTPENQRLRRFYDGHPSPEESYYHSLLLNRPDIRIANNNLRFSQWVNGMPHPQTLGFEDIHNMVGSRAHFGRKFPFDPKLYSAIDAAVHSSSG